MRTFVGLICAGASVVAMAGCQAAATPPPAAAPVEAKPTPVERGTYLVNAMGCDDCHTPHKLGPNGPEPDMTRRLSGHPENANPGPAPKPQGVWMASFSADMTAWAGPWGVSYTANLTPDQNTGLGIWTEDIFIKAIREGKHMGQSRPILPPMPWQVFKNLSDDDLKAIFAYLKSLPPVTNHVPDPIIAAPPPAAK